MLRLGSLGTLVALACFGQFAAVLGEEKQGAGASLCHAASPSSPSLSVYAEGNSFIQKKVLHSGKVGGVVRQPSDPFDADFVRDSGNALDDFSESQAAIESRSKEAAKAQVSLNNPPASQAPPAAGEEKENIASEDASTKKAVSAKDDAPAAPAAALNHIADETATVAPDAAEQPSAVEPAVTGDVVISGANLSACVTKYDDRINAWWRTTAKPGTPCLFGVDDRDEGKHCIDDGSGQYGSFGWCWTTRARGSWGSCGENCPLYGRTQALARKLDKVEGVLHSIVGHMAGNASKSSADVNSTSSAASASAESSNKSSGGGEGIAKPAANQDEKSLSTPAESASKATPADAGSKAASFSHVANDTTAASTAAPSRGETAGAGETVAPRKEASASTEGSSQPSAEPRQIVPSSNGTLATSSNGTLATASNATNGCATRFDERIKAWWRTAAQPGTPCLFGVDDRDEGKHCIEASGAYGAFGWCWTTRERGAWGSCNEDCPLFGRAEKLAKKLDTVEDVVKRIVQHMDGGSTASRTAAAKEITTKPAKGAGQPADPQ